jgi:2-keto-4-pentenoate hydratase/2-oxohepta-3-ene-1,7-dioic acid hydratase in catechol pathway
MKLGTVLRAGRQVPVLVVQGGAIDLAQALGIESIVALAGAGQRVLEQVRAVQARPQDHAAALIPAGELHWLAPIPRTPRNVFCLGRNYAEHINEDNVSRDKHTQPPEHPQFFTKPASAIVGDGAAIRYDERVTRRLDYEVELAVVIGAGGRDIPADRAMAHVFGYTIVNDVTARDLQKRHDQWFKGKGLDTFCPMGPWIVTADEIPDPHALRIRLSVNGEPRQDASTGDMIFRIPETIASLSAGLTLEPGDVIATGTPSGVGYAMNPRRWLAAGDEIACEVEGVGRLVNRVEAA